MSRATSLSSALPNLVLCLLVLLAASGCAAPEEQQTNALRDLPQIEEEGELRVIFTFNSTGYFIYRGEVMGFEFRLLRAFAEDRGLDLVPRVARDRREVFDLLAGGAGDIVAARLLAEELEAEGDAVVASRPLYETAPTLVQEVQGMRDPQLPEPVEDVVEEQLGEELSAPERTEDRQLRRAPDTKRQLRARLLTRPGQLAGETVHVERGSAYSGLLAELEDRATGEISVVELESATTPETAIERVATSTPRFTVAPGNVARLQEGYFVNVEALPALGTPDPVVWAMRSSSPELRAALDAWLAANGERVAAEYRTYFEERSAFQERVASEYLTTVTGRLSPYDPLLAEHAKAIGWDWRLLAAQAFQESRFDPQARSWAGAVGLLQIMPRTAQEVGVRDLRDPRQNVAGAVRYLEKLDASWKRHLPGLDDEERLPFVLASYNAGAGHVHDARRLAEKHGDDPDAWPDVAYWLLRKSERVVYSDPVVRYGFVRGLEPVTYVELILERYRHYLDFVEPGTPPQGVGTGLVSRSAP